MAHGTSSEARHIQLVQDTAKDTLECLHSSRSAPGSKTTMLGSLAKHRSACGRPAVQQLRQFTFYEAGPLGIVFGDVDLAGESVVVVNSIRPGSMASQHVGLVAGLTVHAVQDCAVAGESFDEVLARIKAAGRPLRLVMRSTAPAPEPEPQLPEPQPVELDSGPRWQLRQFTFSEAGPLGIVFGDVDLAGESVVVVNSIRPGSMASQHVGLVAGLTVHAVQDCAVAGESFDEVLARIKAAGRPLRLVMRSTAPEPEPQLPEPQPVELDSGSKPQAPALPHHQQPISHPSMNANGMLEFTFMEPGPLGITFGDVAVRPDLVGNNEHGAKPPDVVVISSIRPGSPASRQVGLVPGLLLDGVQGEPVHSMEFSEILTVIKLSSRPLRLRLRPVDGADLCFSPLSDKGQNMLVDTGLAGETPRVTRVFETEQTRTSAAIERVWRKHQQELPVPATQHLRSRISHEEESLTEAVANVSAACALVSARFERPAPLGLVFGEVLLKKPIPTQLDIREEVSEDHAPDDEFGDHSLRRSATVVSLVRHGSEADELGLRPGMFLYSVGDRLVEAGYDGNGASSERCADGSFAERTTAPAVGFDDALRLIRRAGRPVTLRFIAHR